MADGVEAASSLRDRWHVDKLLRVIQAEADAAGRVDWNVSVDSSIVRAHQHSATAKRSARDRARRAHRGGVE